MLCNQDVFLFGCQTESIIKFSRSWKYRNIDKCTSDRDRFTSLLEAFCCSRRGRKFKFLHSLREKLIFFCLFHANSFFHFQGLTLDRYFLMDASLTFTSVEVEHFHCIIYKFILRMSHSVAFSLTHSPLSCSLTRSYTFSTSTIN